MTRKSLEIAEVLELEILSGKFAPGMLLNEPELANRFGVSRTPVREALLNLSATELVELKRGTGAIVIGMSLDTVFEAYEVLANSLGFACALAAERMTPRLRAELQTIVEEMVQRTSKEDRERYIELDERLHETILEGAGNSMLALQVRRIKRRISAIRQLSMRSHETVDQIVPELEKVVSGIQARDGEAARLALINHVSVRGDGAQKLMAQWQKLTEQAA